MRALNFNKIPPFGYPCHAHFKHYKPIKFWVCCVRMKYVWITMRQRRQHINNSSNRKMILSTAFDTISIIESTKYTPQNKIHEQRTKGHWKRQIENCRSSCSLAPCFGFICIQIKNQDIVLQSERHWALTFTMHPPILNYGWHSMLKGENKIDLLTLFDL